MVASKLGYLYLDTGAMYRAMALKALRAGIDLGDPEALGEQAKGTNVEVEPDPGGIRVVLDGEDVTEQLRALDVTQASSVVAAAKGVRARMVELQRKIGARGGIVAEGRDIGSVVFPDAEVKIYLDADISARAERRKKELDAKGEAVDISRIEGDIRARDARDSGREHSPLVIPDGAIIVDTTNLTIDEQVERVVEEAGKATGGEGS
jgi:cytidylate kinase